MQALRDLLDQQVVTLSGSIATVDAKIQPAVDAAISALVDGAPGALDTLKELAAALTAEGDALAALVTVVGTKASKDELDDAVSTERSRAVAAENALNDAIDTLGLTTSNAVGQEALARDAALEAERLVRVAAEDALLQQISMVDNKEPLVFVRADNMAPNGMTGVPYANEAAGRAAYTGNPSDTLIFAVTGEFGSEYIVSSADADPVSRPQRHGGARRRVLLRRDALRSTPPPACLTAASTWTAPTPTPMKRRRRVSAELRTQLLYAQQKAAEACRRRPRAGSVRPVRRPSRRSRSLTPAAWLHFGLKAYHNVQADGTTHLYSLDGTYTMQQLLAVYVNGVRQSEHDTYELAVDGNGNNAVKFGDGSEELLDDIVTYDLHRLPRRGHDLSPSVLLPHLPLTGAGGAFWLERCAQHLRGQGQVLGCRAHHRRSQQVKCPLGLSSASASSAIGEGERLSLSLRVLRMTALGSSGSSGGSESGSGLAGPFLTLTGAAA